MNCPKCQATRSTTVKRRSRGDDDLRLRQCAVCGETWITREQRLTAIELWDELIRPPKSPTFSCVKIKEMEQEEFI